MENIRESIENDCPSNDFEIGGASGTCFSDGHYMCQECAHLRKDFHGEEGFKKREAILEAPQFYIFTLKK